MTAIIQDAEYVFGNFYFIHGKCITSFANIIIFIKKTTAGSN